MSKILSFINPDIISDERIKYINYINNNFYLLINDLKHQTLSDQKAIRTWFINTYPNICVKIDKTNNQFKNIFGDVYYTDLTKKWNGYLLCIGDNYYVQIVDNKYIMKTYIRFFKIKSLILKLKLKFKLIK